ncbi:MAG: hydrogenase iron-sulfur subunit [Desulfobacteraceae bacterium]|nr:hydrogenase iron-sulfur subunit [Desulfobacteraceae bacterium]
MPFQKETLILGSGPCADQLVGHLAAHGVSVRQVTMSGAAAVNLPTISGGKPIQRLDGAQLVQCQGIAGEFSVVLDDGTKPVRYKVSSIVVVPECLHVPNHDLYGLNPSEKVLALSALEKMLQRGSVQAIIPTQARVVFLNSWSIDPHPVMAQAMLQGCLEMQQKLDVRTFFLCGNLKVSVDGMEACYELAKKAGTAFVKFSDRFPVLVPLADGRIQIDYWDETTRMEYRLVADLVILDEQIMPDPRLADIVRQLRLESDDLGFAQSDNVHRLPNWTNRRGIFVAGGARAVLTEAALSVDANQTAQNVIAFLSGLDRAPLPKVEIDPGRCARCLTCYRLCPHAAITMEPRMIIHAEACQSCGLCVAACPNRAIQLQDSTLETAFNQQAGQGAQAQAQSSDCIPRIALFCCSRSAAQARELAKSMGHQLPASLRFVEGVCGGTFSVRHMLTAIEAGLDGILVLTCHEGNCHSGKGPHEADKRVREAARLLTGAGIAPERLQFTTLAANMGREFAEVVNGFEEKIKALGPV